MVFHPFIQKPVPLRDVLFFPRILHQFVKTLFVTISCTSKMWVWIVQHPQRKETSR